MIGSAPAEADEAGQAEPAPEDRSFLEKAWGQSLWAHAAVLLLVLLALLPLMSPNSSFTSDEGAYALQVEALEAGWWEYDYKAAPYDPGGRHFPVYLSSRSESGYFPYIKHPAYPLLVQAARKLAGPTLGLHLLALLGTVGTAAAAWLLAAELNPRLSRSAFWLAATGPVLVNGFVIWAHAPSAALAGLALVGAARILRRDFTPAVTAGVVAALVGGVLLRSEGLLFAGAVTSGLALVRFRQGLRLRSVTPLLLAVPAAVTALAEHAWISDILGERFQTVGVRQGRFSYFEGRIAGAFHELLHPPGQSPEAALPMLVALVLVAGLGFLALRRWGSGSQRLLTVVTVGTLVILAFRLLTRPFDPVTGLVAAWPVGLLGLLLVRWRRAEPVIALLGVTAASFAVSVLLTQYPEGGAIEWGGRFLSPTLVPLAVLAGAGLAGALTPVPRPQLRPVTAMLTTVALAFAAFGVLAVGRQRARIEGVAAAVARHPAAVTITTGHYLPRAAWAIDDRVTWMRADRSELSGLLSVLRARGLRQVAVVGPPDIPVTDLSAFPVVEERPEPDLREVGLRLLVGKA